MAGADDRTDHQVAPRTTNATTGIGSWSGCSLLARSGGVRLGRVV